MAHFHAEFNAQGHPVHVADVIEETFSNPLDGWALLAQIVSDEWEKNHNAAGMESADEIKRVDSVYQPLYAAICDMGTTGAVIMKPSGLTSNFPIEYRIRACDNPDCNQPVAGDTKVIKLSDWSARFSEIHAQALLLAKDRHPAGKGLQRIDESSTPGTA